MGRRIGAVILLVVITAGLLPGSLLGGDRRRGAEFGGGKVVKVLDGDSLLIRENGKMHEVRLYGIDAPEHGQEYGDLAGNYTRKNFQGRVVSVRVMDVDKYGRKVALVESEGRLISRELVREGMAWVYPWFCREEPLCSEMKGLQRQAEKAKKGLWEVNSPEAPWVWKKKRR